ncbi:anti-sigma factor family protein [Rhodoplanes sp. SY1]|uniref:anti-sigma factor family protein n=1 Tax=Rhodoplanes sp. SY1 TaxID=3166646 RepID=UPI0038B67EEE
MTDPTCGPTSDPNADPISEADLDGFVDDQLGPARRVEVEDHLARHPEAAARVMADLRTRDALRLAFGATPRPSGRLQEAARRLDRALAWRRIDRGLRRVAAVTLLVGAGWIAHAQSDRWESEGPPGAPDFVEDARHAHETALVRARMASQRQGAAFNPAEILAFTGIALPPLPPEWRVIDAQVFPSRLGHSVEVVLDADTLGRVSMFAARSPAPDTVAPTAVRSAGETTVYWQSGERIYALTGDVPDRALAQAATRLGAGR